MKIGVKEAALTEGAIAFLDKPLDIELAIRLIADTAEASESLQRRTKGQSFNR